MSADEPSEAEHAFYEAFSRLDLEAMGRLWADGDEVSCIHPGGHLIRGKDEVLQSWGEIFASASPPTIEYRSLSTQQADGLAVHLVEEMIRPSGQRSTEAGRVLATNVYVLRDGAWRMLAHHASLPLVRGPSGRTRGPLH
ncbi:MAG: nuclear transport factor 2 family protein [Chromatiales bacterium]|jgi:uncharacterized protein (TIGR02246 family)